MAKVAVVVNANARRFVERPALVEEIARLCAGRARLHVTVDRATLAEAARACRADDVDAVVIAGGDGSYGAGATALLDAYGDAGAPTIALAPGGTVGTVPRTLGLAPRGTTLDGVARLLHAAIAGRFETRVTPTLAIAADGGARRIGFIFGTGLVARFFALYDRRASSASAGAGESARFAPSGGAGLTGAARIVARVFAESFFGGAYARAVLDPIRCDVEVDGARLPWPGTTLLVASVIDDLGMGMRVTPRAGEDPRRPHVVASGLPPRRLGPRMPRVLRGRPIGDPGEPCFDGLAGALRVTFPEGPGPYVVDGDARRAHVVEVGAGPQLRLLRLV